MSEVTTEPEEKTVPVEDAEPEAPTEVVIKAPVTKLVEEEPEEEEKSEEGLPPILDLSQLSPTRRLVKLPVPTEEDPKATQSFELRLLDDFGIIDQQSLLQQSRTFEKLWNADEPLDKNGREQLKFLMNSMFNKVLIAPKETREGMPDNVRSRVVTAFSRAPLIEQLEAQQAEAERQAKDLEDKEEEEETNDLPTTES